MQTLNPQLPARIWLASKSPRRRELIETLGIEARVFLFKTGDEAEELETPFVNEDPLAYVERVTLLKMQEAMKAVSASIEQGQTSGIILTADTTVAKDGLILGKPQNAEEAASMLRALSGSVHQVHTAVAVSAWLENCAENWTEAAVQTSEVNFGTIPESFIQRYVESGEPFDKAGGYGIQGTAGQFVRHISGSHSGIMGLPLYETGLHLERAVAWLAQSNQRSK